MKLTWRQGHPRGNGREQSIRHPIILAQCYAGVCCRRYSVAGALAGFSLVIPDGGKNGAAFTSDIQVHPGRSGVGWFDMVSSINAAAHS